MIREERSLNGLPDWTPEETAAHFAYLRPLFTDAIREGTRRLKRRADAHATFSLAGRLLTCAMGVSDISCKLEPVLVVRALRDRGDAMRLPPVGGIERKLNHAAVRALTVVSGSRTGLMLDLVDSESGKRIRPFFLRIADEDGEVVLARREIGVMTTPYLPRIDEGVYICEFEWKDERARIEIAFDEPDTPSA
ncbi:MAG: hypothetical protein KA184_00785 [Candidatus Hydrogenedentes bacterium]|nr:hypothetical protein [Candidatus Hydrogenedentota bacterium]